MKKTILAIGLCVIGMVGLYLKIEYSGWVLFFGLMVVASE
jgi:hypothetical protein